jgi:hypothetical protein
MSLTASIASRPASTGADLRVESVVRLLRFAAAAMILAFGRMLPNVGAVFVVVLGIFFAGYGLLIARAWSRVRTDAERARTARFTLAADISLVGFALFVFSPDPGWTVYVCGFVVVASGAFRVQNGSLLAAASISLTYVVVMIWRMADLGMEVSVGQVVIHLGGYVSAGVLLNAVLPELDALREREHDLYEPILGRNRSRRRRAHHRRQRTDLLEQDARAHDRSQRAGDQADPLDDRPRHPGARAER